MPKRKNEHENSSEQITSGVEKKTKAFMPRVIFNNDTNRPSPVEVSGRKSISPVQAEDYDDEVDALTSSFGEKLEFNPKPAEFERMPSFSPSMFRSNRELQSTSIDFAESSIVKPISR